MDVAANCRLGRQLPAQWLTIHLQCAAAIVRRSERFW